MKAKKAKKKARLRTFRVLVQGKAEADDFVVKVKAHTRDEAEADAADKYRPKWVKVLS